MGIILHYLRPVSAIHVIEVLKFFIDSTLLTRVRSLAVSDLRSKTKGSWFELG